MDGYRFGGAFLPSLIAIACGGSSSSVPGSNGGTAPTAGMTGAGRGGDAGMTANGGAGMQAGRGGSGGATGGAAGTTPQAGRGGSSGGASGAGRGGTGGATGGSGGSGMGGAGTTGNAGEDSGGDGGSAAVSGSAGSGGGCGNCDWECCGAQCVNKGNDINNCGDCGVECDAGEACNDGECGPPTCSAPMPCMTGEFCCGLDCCEDGLLCCSIPGPVSTPYPVCTEPDSRGTCPTGCNGCKCAAPGTLIATPSGERPIAELVVGDLVYSVEGEAIVPVPIAAVRREPAVGHAVPRLSLDNGRTLEISAGHPTADGRLFGDVAPGDRLGEARVVGLKYVAYAYPFTHDILPASSTGTYFADGALIGTTLGEATGSCR
jgi:hypothetical protein